MHQIKEAVVNCHSDSVWDDIEVNGNMVQLIMDCTFDGVLPSPPDSQQLDAIESSTRKLCHALHWLRKRLFDDF